MMENSETEKQQRSSSSKVLVNGRDTRVVDETIRRLVVNQFEAIDFRPTVSDGICRTMFTLPVEGSLAATIHPFSHSTVEGIFLPKYVEVLGEFEQDKILNHVKGMKSKLDLFVCRLQPESGNSTKAFSELHGRLLSRKACSYLKTSKRPLKDAWLIPSDGITLHEQLLPLGGPGFPNNCDPCLLAIVLRSRNHAKHARGSTGPNQNLPLFVATKSKKSCFEYDEGPEGSVSTEKPFFDEGEPKINTLAFSCYTKPESLFESRSGGGSNDNRPTAESFRNDHTEPEQIENLASEYILDNLSDQKEIIFEQPKGPKLNSLVAPEVAPSTSSANVQNLTLWEGELQQNQVEVNGMDTDELKGTRSPKVDRSCSSDIVTTEKSAKIAKKAAGFSLPANKLLQEQTDKKLALVAAQDEIRKTARLTSMRKQTGPENSAYNNEKLPNTGKADDKEEKPATAALDKSSFGGAAAANTAWHLIKRTNTRRTSKSMKPKRAKSAADSAGRVFKPILRSKAVKSNQVRWTPEMIALPAPDVNIRRVRQPSPVSGPSVLKERVKRRRYSRFEREAPTYSSSEDEDDVGSMCT